MTQLLESAVNYLKTYYASDPKVYKSAHKRKNAAGFRGTSAIHVITLANLVQDTALLPVALMECCIYGEDIMDGFKHEDGTVEHLSRDYLKHCYRARLTLMKANMEAYMDIFNYPPPLGCMKYDKCKLERMACLRNVDHCIDLATCTNYDPLLSSREVWLCSSCYTMLRGRAEVAQLKIWKRLPKILGITVDGWHGTSSNSLERSEGDTGSDSDSSTSISNECVTCASSFVSYTSVPNTCEPFDMSDVRGVRGGCDESGFIWNEDVSFGGSYEEDNRESCTVTKEEDAEWPWPPYGKVIEDMVAPVKWRASC